jgi:DNA-binding NarL/FixJ family response regulator
MPGVEGQDVIESLVRQYPKVKILIVSMYPEKIYGLRAIRLGVAGYFKKTFPMTELPEAVERVASGGRYISGTLAEELARELGKDGGDKHGFETLSNRELQVFHLLARGKRISIIAEELNLSVKTVSTYKSRICDKLGLHTSGEIIVYAHTNKLLNGNAE